MIFKRVVGDEEKAYYASLREASKPATPATIETPEASMAAPKARKAPAKKAAPKAKKAAGKASKPRKEQRPTMMFDNVKAFKEEFARRLSEKFGRTVEDSHITERYDVLGEMVRDYAGYSLRDSMEDVNRHGRKQLIYFSMEFLIGRLLLNNMQNLGVYEVAKKGLAEYGIDISELEDQERDAGLGNGGLGPARPPWPSRSMATPSATSTASSARGSSTGSKSSSPTSGSPTASSSR